MTLHTSTAASKALNRERSKGKDLNYSNEENSHVKHNVWSTTEQTTHMMVSPKMLLFVLATLVSVVTLYMSLSDKTTYW